MGDQPIPENVDLTRSLRDLFAPVATNSPLCIVLPPNNATHFDLKPHVIQLLPSFHSLEMENPYSHVRKFKDICATFKFQNFFEESVHLRLFPFSLHDTAKMSKVNECQKEISSFIEEQDEKFSESWKRFKESARILKNRGIYELKEATDLRMKIDALTMKVDALAVSQSINAANIFNVDSCSICASPMHLAQNCSSLPAFAECPMEQVNAFNDYYKQASGPHSETYNLEWRNHPNFSWKQNQPINQGGAPHHAQNQYPLGFLPPVQNHGRLAHPTPPPAYQAPNQVPASSSQSTLEDTLKAFMQLISQFISEVKNATMGDKWTIKWFYQKREHIVPRRQDSGKNECRDAEPSRAIHTVEDSPRTFVPKAPYLERLQAPKKGGKFEDILEVFKQDQIDISFLDAIQQVTSYAKFLKDLITVKRRTNVPRKAFLTEQFGLGKLKPTSMTLQLADSKQPLEYDKVRSVCLIEKIIEETVDESSIEDPLEACLAQFGDDLDLDKLFEQADAILETAPMISIENGETVVLESPKLELKPLLDTLKYKFLGPTKSLHVIIALDLISAQEEKSLDVFRKHKEAIG
ncbi:uncharacterized protein LOC132187905 [Corylus avellana]|uniref:uncharacterized protein LOC132187905 n=1 Tax=Corylus avellana TaxID=13451 RepID=UPI00286C3F37|nr:uncharacterized protein LOC132187905 [Corylus avellana]